MIAQISFLFIIKNIQRCSLKLDYLTDRFDICSQFKNKKGAQ